MVVITVVMVVITVVMVVITVVMVVITVVMVVITVVMVVITLVMVVSSLIWKLTFFEAGATDTAQFLLEITEIDTTLPFRAFWLCVDTLPKRLGGWWFNIR